MKSRRWMAPVWLATAHLRASARSSGFAADASGSASETAGLSQRREACQFARRNRRQASCTPLAAVTCGQRGGDVQVAAASGTRLPHMFHRRDILGGQRTKELGSLVGARPCVFRTAATPHPASRGTKRNQSPGRVDAPSNKQHNAGGVVDDWGAGERRA